MPEYPAWAPSGTSVQPVDVPYTFWRPTGAIAETLSRQNALSNIAAVASGLLHVTAIVLPVKPITSITFVSGTAGATMTNQWFCLIDNALNVLGKTADDGANAWAATTAKTLNITGGPITPAYAGLHYLGKVVVASGSVPGTAGFVDASSSYDSIGGLIVAGSSNSGLTNPASLGAQAAAFNSTNGGNKDWGWVS